MFLFFFFLFSQEEDKNKEESVRKVTELECKSKFAFQCYKSMVGHSVFMLIKAEFCSYNQKCL